MDYEKEFLEEIFMTVPDITINKKHGYIYFLNDENGKPLYIGQTRNILARIFLDHSKNYDFKEVRILKYPIEKLEFAEKYFIRKYEPILNVKKYKIFDYIPGDGKTEIRKYLHDNEMTIKDFSSAIGYEREHIQAYLCGSIRLGPKAAKEIEKFTKGIIKKEFILSGNVPYKNKRIEKEYIQELMNPI